MRARIYLVLFLLLVVLAGSAYACSEAMRVREVVVLGCEVRDPAEVVDLASIANEESIFKLNFDQIRQKIDANPYFEVQSINYVFPDKLRISVNERRASAVVNQLGSIIVIDETGFVLEVRDSLGDLSLPVVSGLRVTGGYQVGQTLTSDQESQMDALHAILTQLHEQNATQLISEINLEAVSDLWMTTVSGFEVRLGNFEDMEDKIRWLRAVEPVLVSEGYAGGVITVSTGENASYLPPQAIRPQDTPQEDQPEETPVAPTDEPAQTTEPESTAQPEESGETQPTPTPQTSAEPEE